MKLSVNFFIFSLIIAATSVRADTIKCAFGYEDMKISYSQSYYCSLQNPQLFEDDPQSITITDAIGNHKDGKTNKDVEVISFGHVYGFWPKGFENVFPNLIGISIFSSQISELTKDHLKPFPKLKGLWLYYNDIKVIPADLFINNPLLERIGLDTNKIEHIDKFAFSGLTNLKYLLLDDNVCTGLSNAEYKHQVVKLVKKIEEGICTSDKYAAAE